MRQISPVIGALHHKIHPHQPEQAHALGRQPVVTPKPTLVCQPCGLPRFKACACDGCAALRDFLPNATASILSRCLFAYRYLFKKADSVLR